MTQSFTLEVHEPFSTFTEGAPTPIPFVVDGLFPKAALSVIGAKAKHGKSSLSRCEAVAITKGLPLLDRPTEQGEVLLCSLEDPRQQVDNHLALLGYSKNQDARIHVVSKLARDVTQSVDAIADHLAKNTYINLVVLDTLHKAIRAKDSKDYDEMLVLLEQLHLLARENKAHIQALAHCKKIQHDDPFDNFLGSVELRGEPDTNVVIYDHKGRRLIKSETRMGIPWDEPHVLCAETETVGKTKMVKQFYLGETTTVIAEQQATAQEKNTRTAIANGIVAMLKEHGMMPMGECIEAVPGNRSLKFEIRDELIADGVLALEGVAHSKTSPSRLRLLKPDWTGGLVIANPTPVVESRQQSTQAEPLSEYITCADSNCTTQVSTRGEFCYRHGAEGKGVICVN
jgi:hypothetical protein